MFADVMRRSYPGHQIYVKGCEQLDELAWNCDGYAVGDGALAQNSAVVVGTEGDDLDVQDVRPGTAGSGGR